MSLGVLARWKSVSKARISEYNLIGRSPHIYTAVTSNKSRRNYSFLDGRTSKLNANIRTSTPKLKVLALSRDPFPRYQQCHPLRTTHEQGISQSKNHITLCV
jgi:hypothetical protein